MGKFTALITCIKLARQNHSINFLTSVVVCFFSFQTTTSATNIDSLEQCYIKAKADTEKINLSIRIVNYYAKTKDPLGLDYAIKSYQLSEKVKSKKHKLKAANTIAQAYFNYNVPSKSAKYNVIALEHSKALKDSVGTCNILSRLSKVYVDIGEHEKGATVLKEMIELTKAIKNKSLEARACVGMAALNYNQANYSQSIKHFLKAITLYKATGDSNEIYSLYGNLSLTYEQIGNYKEALKANQKAERYFLNKNDTDGLKTVYGRYGGLFQSMGKIDSAEFYFEKQLELANQLPDDGSKTMIMGNLALIYKSRGQYVKAKTILQAILDVFNKQEAYRLAAITYVNLSEIETQLKKYSKAAEYGNLALEYGKRTGEKEITKTAYLTLYNSSFLQNDFKTALDYYKKHKEISDSIIKSANANEIAELKNKHQIAEKEKENKLLRAENKLNEAELKKNKTFIYSVSAGGFMLLIMVIVSFRAYRQKRKSNLVLEEQNKLINQQKEAINNQKELVEEINKEMVDSITYAKRLQNAILPPESYVQQALPGSFVMFRPKDIVSGDFYVVEQLPEKTLFGAIDCTGHGVPGAFMSIVGHNGLSKAIGEYGMLSPGKILDFLHANLTKTFSKGQTQDIKDGMDASLCTLNNKTLQLEFAGAMNPLYIIRDNEIEEIKGDKMPIGGDDKSSNYTTHTIQLEKGNAIYIFSDGFADQFGGDKGKKFKYKPFKELLLSIYREEPERQREVLEETFESWRGNLQQVDDVCIIGVRL